MIADDWLAADLWSQVENESFPDGLLDLFSIVGHLTRRACVKLDFYRL